SREVVVSPNHDHLQKRRREMGTEAFQREARNRNAIEGTISELVRGYGLRKTRYRGWPRPDWQTISSRLPAMRAAGRSRSLGRRTNPGRKPLDGAKESVNLNQQSHEHLKARHC
ncbi:MAG: hypothetical protein EHM23_34010, partial [Acidobacteria bacterium]